MIELNPMTIDLHRQSSTDYRGTHRNQDGAAAPHAAMTTVLPLGKALTVAQDLDEPGIAAMLLPICSHR
jgi:hypothetical protein